MLMKTRFFVAVVAFLLVLGTAATASARGLTSSETSVLRAMNSARTSHGLAPLRVDYRLERAARAHSADMLRHQYFAHGSFFARLSGSGAAGPVFGEILAWGPVRASSVVCHRLARPEQRANLPRAGVRRVGVGALTGTFEGSAGAFVVTADFAGT